MSQLPPTAHRDSISALPNAPHASDETGGVWTKRLVIFLRAMAVLSLVKGMYHWAQVLGIGVNEADYFEFQSLSWQTATVYFAVIDLVAAVGLWLATPWGAVLWLTAVISMAVVDLMFPQIYGGNLLTVAGEFLLLIAYLGLAWMAAYEHPS